MKKKKLSRIYKGKEILCVKCKTKKFRTIIGNPKEKYGIITVHKVNCLYVKKLLKNAILAIPLSYYS